PSATSPRSGRAGSTRPLLANHDQPQLLESRARTLALPFQPESGGPAAPATAQPQRWTVLEVLRWTTSRFAQRNLASPRLDAEVLARLGAAAAGPVNLGRALRMADVGTGSGAIPIAIAKMLGKTVAKAEPGTAPRPAPEIVASDISPGALEVARANAERHAAA